MRRSYTNNKKYKKTYKKKYNVAVRRERFNSDMLSLKTECYASINVPNLNNKYLFSATGTNNISISDLLATNPTFTDVVSKYSSYKITGIGLHGTVRQPIQTGVAKGYVPCCFSFHSSIFGTDLGSTPIYNDKKIQISPSITTVQSGYWRFPKDYFAAGNGGYGTWNPSPNYNLMLGQISCHGITAMSSSTADVYVFDVKFVIYTTFKDKAA